MGVIQSFQQLEAWQVNHEVALSVYRETEKYPKAELFGIVSQMRRAASSVTANIAEGWGRFHYPDKIRFLYQARGSNSEVENFLILSKDLGYLRASTFYKLSEAVRRGGKVLNGLIRALEKKKKDNVT